MRINTLEKKLQSVISISTQRNTTNSEKEYKELSSSIQQAIADLIDEIYNNYTQLGNKFLIQLLKNHDAKLLAAARIYQDPAQIPTNDTTPAIVISVSDKSPLTQTTNRLIHYVGSVSLTLQQGNAKVYSEQANVKAHGNSTVYAYGHTHVESDDHATVYLQDNSRCRAKGGTIYASDHSFVQEEESSVVHLFGYSGGYFPYGVSQITASESAQLLYRPASPIVKRPAVELSDKAILLLDNPNDHPINIIRQSRYSLLIDCQERHIAPKDYLDYLYQRNQVSPTANYTQRTNSLESLKRKVSRYIQKKTFLQKLSTAKDENAIIKAMMPYLPQTLGLQGMTIEFLRSHFKKETLLAHNIYAYDDAPYIPNRPNQPGQPIFLFGAQVGHFTEKEQFYTYEQAFAFATGQATGTLNGHSQCIGKDQAVITAKDLSHAYVSDQVQFQIEERAEGCAIGNAKGILKDNGYMRIYDHVQLQMKGQSRCEAKGWSQVTLRDQSIALVDPFVTVISKEESTVGIVTTEETISERIRQQDLSCILLIPNKRECETFREQYLSGIDKPAIVDFLNGAIRQQRDSRPQHKRYVCQIGLR